MVTLRFAVPAILATAAAAGCFSYFVILVSCTVRSRSAIAAGRAYLRVLTRGLRPISMSAQMRTRKLPQLTKKLPRRS